MIILNICNYSGRNIFSHKPVVKMVVDLEDLTSVSSAEITGFNQHLLEFFPGLATHCCSTGHPGGFVERLYEGTYMAHVIEHVALELQSVLGYDVYFGKTRMAGEPSQFTIIFEYINAYCCQDYGRAAVEIVSVLVHGRPELINDIISRLRRLSLESNLGPGTQAIWDEARKRHIPIRRLGSDSMLQLGYGKYMRTVESSLIDTTSCIAVDLAQNKQLVKNILKEHNIPVPEGGLADSEDAAIILAEQLGYPVVVKPFDGNHGQDITVNINDRALLQAAYLRASRYSKQVIIERHIPGKDYRILVVGDQVSAVAERRPPSVVGNGLNTIEELVAAENKNPLRGTGHEKPLTRIRLDKCAQEVLARCGLEPNSVPEAGEKVCLRENGNLSTGGSARDCTMEIHPENKTLAVKAAQAIGLDIAGIDVVMDDISQPLSPLNGAMIEVNACPGLRMHLYPSEGQPRNVAQDILNLIYPRGTPFTVPIISVTGTNGKTTVTRMIHHVLSLSGRKVGMTCSSGTYVGQECISRGDNTGPISAQSVLYNREVEIAVLETARGGIIRKGLGYDLADLGIVTNVSDDHLGLDGVNTLKDMAFVKALVVEAVKPNGYAVLNADDEMTEYIKSLVRCNLVYFSQKRGNPLIENHIVQGKMAILAENGQVMVYRNNAKYPLLKLQDIPITFNGRVLCNIENSLAAISSLIALGVPDNIIRLGLRAFRPDPQVNAGRFNLFEMGDFKVMLDYGHTPSGYLSVIHFLESQDASRRVGIIGMPGDRSNEAIKKVGRIAGQFFSRLYIKEDIDLRNRAPGEVANLLYQGAVQGGMDEAQIDIVLSERDALLTAMDQAQSGDFIVVFYEDFDSVLQVVQGFRGDGPARVYSPTLSEQTSIPFKTDIRPVLQVEYTDTSGVNVQHH